MTVGRWTRKTTTLRAETARNAVPVLFVFLLAVFAGPLALRAHAEPAWTTYHHDAARSGVDPEVLSPIAPARVWWSPDLGAPIWSQPLILGSRVYVATLGDRIYSLDATTGKVIWSVSAGTPVPANAGRCQPEVGVVGTPVIDPRTQTLYAVADTWDASRGEAHHLLEGFSLATGAQLLSMSVDPPGSDPGSLLQRPALNLDEGKVVIGFGGNPGDCGVYRGAVVAAPEAGGLSSVWQYPFASPAIGGGAVWGSGGPAVDAEGHIYASTGNPNVLPEDKGKITTYDYSDSVIRLDSSMHLLGNFEPESWLYDSNHDVDMGSAGPELLPGGLLFQAGKNEMGYLIDESTMASGAPAVYSQKVCNGAREGEGSFGGDAFAVGTIYVPCNDGVRALAYDQAARRFSILWHGPADAIEPPIVSEGLVWVLSGKFLHGEGTTLYALDPATGKPRFTETLPSPTADHFASPSAAGGRVFVATGSTVTAYEIGRLEPPIVTTEPVGSITATAATLSGSVNPEGSALSDCRFEYGTSIPYTLSAPCSSLPGSGTSVAPVSTTVEGLASNTTYHVRFAASNAAGARVGDDRTFTTAPRPPVVTASPASAVSQSTATLNASIEPNGAPVEDCHFDFGTTSSYGSSVPCTSTPPADAGPTAISAPVAGLAAGTTYYFRATATNAGGLTDGAQLTLTTLPASQAQVITVSNLNLFNGSGLQEVLGLKEQKSSSPSEARLLSRSLTSTANGTVIALVRCVGGAKQCSGVLTLRTGAAVRLGTRTRVLILARAVLNLAVGQPTTITLHLSARARRLLARKRVLKIRATIVLNGPAGSTHTSQSTLKLRVPRFAHRASARRVPQPPWRSSPDSSPARGLAGR